MVEMLLNVVCLYLDHSVGFHLISIPVANFLGAGYQRAT